MTVMTGLVCGSECCSAQVLCVAVLDSRTTATAGFRLASTVSKSFLPDFFTIRAGLPAISSPIYICPLAPSGQDRAPLYLVNSLLSWRFRWVIFSKEVTEASSNQMRTEGVPGSGRPPAVILITYCWVRPCCSVSGLTPVPPWAPLEMRVPYSSWPWCFPRS